MKRKLIVTLVATALELYAATAGAQAGCGLVGNATTASGATAVTTGPLNPIDGFPEYITDSTGLSVQRCTNANFCFFDPVVPTDPFSLQIGTGGEAFYWGADATLDSGGRRVATVVMAAESAFLQAGPNGEPIDGTQFPFLRLRFTIGVPRDGTYTVTHPFGVDKFTVVGATGARDIFSTVDRGLSPSTPGQLGPVGPWLKWDPAALLPGSVIPAGYLGDSGPNGVANRVIGSPCGRNTVTLTGVDTSGRPVAFAGGETTLTTNVFTVQGKIYDGKVQTPLNPTRLTYSRTLAGAGQIDNFAASTATAAVSVVDGPTIPVGTSRIPLALTLDHLALSATAGINSLSVPVLDASAVPPIVSMTATDPTAATPTDPTTLNLPLVDFVDIAVADYDPGTQVLTVTATSGDLRSPPTLTLSDFGAFAAGTSTKLVTTVAPPGFVTVTSSAGGSSTTLVRVVASAPPAAPTGLALSSATSTTVTLTWADASNNETGFNVYTVAATGARTLVGTVGANSARAVITGLTAGTAYTFQVDAFNNAGAASSTTLSASTLALPVAASGVTAALGAQRAINVSWTDNSADETGFVVLRGTSATGPFTQVASVAANVRSATDTNGPPATGATYFYQVVAVRGGDSSAAVTSAQGLTTPTAPTSALIAAPVAASGTQVNVSWTDRAVNETGYQVYRSTTTTGGFAAVSGVLAAGTTNFSDSTVVAGTQYFYRVDASNWAATVQSAISTGVTPPAAAVTLAAPGNLAVASAIANPPVLGWTDTSTGETGFRVQRRTVTLANNGTRTNGAFATAATTAANAVTFTDTARTANAIVEYSVAAVNGATVGTASTVLAVPGGIPGVTAAPTFTRTGNTVTVRWAQAGTTTANRAAIGGYSVQRCTVTTTDTCAATSAGWASVATATGRTTVTANNTVAVSAPTRTYRYRVVSTTGPNAVTGVTGTPSPASATLVR